MKNKLKEMKGITLIALVITIIVLLILAGVSIATLTGENGILTQATNAKEQTELAEADEMFKLIANEWQIEKRKTDADLGTFLDDKKEEGKLTSEAIYNEAEKTYTIEYNGEKIKIDNSGTLTEVPENEEPTTLAPGLYAEDGTFTSWQTLIDNDILVVEDGVLKGTVGHGYDYECGAHLLLVNGKLVIDSSVTSIGYMVFGCMYASSGYENNMTELIISDSVIDIGEYSIVRCDKLKKVTLPCNITKIDEGAFYGCGNLETIFMTNKVTTIELLAFMNCSNLTTINYLGTKAEWNSIEKLEDEHNDWNKGCPEITVHCSDGDIIIPSNS